MNNFLYQYWGKARNTGIGEQATLHLLPYHCLDVAAVADCWWRQDTALQNLFVRAAGGEPQRLRGWLLFFIALHDLGKFDVRFQWKAPEAARCLQAAFEKKHARGDCKNFDHGGAGYAWFGKEAGVYGFGDYPDSADEWMRAVAKHHGFLSSQSSKNGNYAAAEVVRHDAQARAAWVAALREHFLEPLGIHAGEQPPSLSAQLLAGFCSVADWIGSNPGENGEYFSYVDKPGISVADYLLSRQEIAARALHDSGMYRPALSRGGMAVFRDIQARGVQTLVDDIPLEPGMTLIEAPTGSGKTEAALAYASRLLAAGLADSIVFALPTQATGNAMFKRIQDIAEFLFPDHEHGRNLVLAHGKAQFNQDFQKLKNAARQGNNVQGKEEALNQCSQWLAAGRKRVFLGQIGICTIDQVLLSVLPIRHNFVRALGVRKSILIIDEIHAYDWYMYGLLSALLQEQARSGGSLILLSATLPTLTKERLFASWQVGDKPAMSKAYPLISHLGASPWIPPNSSPPSKTERTVLFTLHTQPELLPDAPLLDEVIEAAACGAKVALVCNLVADAQNVWNALRQRLQEQAREIPLDLFHARFRFCDRQGIEQSVLNDYGKDAPPGGRILVATQVVEQSLDLDFDWLITQICPVDLLFQRLGRLHRHSRPRPLGDAPRCVVLVPGGSDYSLHGFLYGADALLWRTQSLLEQHGQADFPFAYRDWIEQVYQEDTWPDEPADVYAAYAKHLDENLGKLYSGKAVAVTDTYLGDDDESPLVQSQTRDGEMSLSVIPCVRDGDSLAFLDGTRFDSLDEWQWQEQVNLNTVAVPHSWSKDFSPGPDRFNKYIQRYLLEMRADGEGIWQGRSGERDFSYSALSGLKRREEG